MHRMHVTRAKAYKIFKVPIVIVGVERNTFELFFNYSSQSGDFDVLLKLLCY